MVAKKIFNMDMLTDLLMSRLFQLAEYVCCALVAEKPGAPVAPAKPTQQKEVVPIIRFSDQDRMVEGELFK